MWTIEYDNDTGPSDDSFSETWIVTDGVKSFEASSQEVAEWLRDTLNALDRKGA